MISSAALLSFGVWLGCGHQATTPESELDAGSNSTMDAGPSMDAGDCLTAEKGLFGISGLSDGAVWAVGEAGLAVRHNAGPDDSWECMSSGQTESLAAVWAASATSVYVSGTAGLLIHWDGSAWRRIRTDTEVTLSAIWGFVSAGEEDVWVGGSEGTLLHYRAASQAAPAFSGTRSQIMGIWGASPKDVWAVGLEGTIVHYDGVVWSQLRSDLHGNFNGVWGTAGNDVLFVSADGAAMHWNGSSIEQIAPSELPTTTSEASLNGVWGNAAGDVWIVGRNGLVWTRRSGRWLPQSASTSMNLNRVWVSDAGDCWIVGDYGVIRHLR